MPRRKATIRKLNGRWTAVVPAFGFTRDSYTIMVCASYEDARSWVSGLVDRAELGAASGVRADYGCEYIDGVAEVPRWRPTRRYR